MLGRNKEARIYSSEDIAKADIAWLEHGTIPDLALGSVSWDSWRPRMLTPTTSEQIAEHNSKILVSKTVFEAKPTPVRKRVGVAALAMITSLIK